MAELKKTEGAETKELLANREEKIAEFDPHADLEDGLKKHEARGLGETLSALLHDTFPT